MAAAGFAAGACPCAAWGATSTAVARHGLLRSWPEAPRERGTCQQTREVLLPAAALGAVCGLAAEAFEIGDQVEVSDRSHEEGDWLPGVVVSKGPVLVRPEGWSEAHAWDLIRPKTCPPREPGGRTGLLTMLSISWHHPHLVRSSRSRFLVSGPLLRSPRRLLAILAASRAGALRALVEAVPEKILHEHLKEMLRRLRSWQLRDIVAPVINATEVHTTLVRLLISGLASPRFTTIAVQQAPLENIMALLALPPDVVCSVLASVAPKNVEEVVLPFLRMPPHSLKEAVVPLLRGLRNPERVACLLRHTRTEPLVEILPLVGADRVVELLNTMGAEDVGPQSTIVQVLQMSEAHPDIIGRVLGPLITQTSPEKCAMLLRYVDFGKLRPILLGADVSDMLVLLEVLGAKQAAVLMNGPLQLLSESRRPDAVGCVGGIADHMKGLACQARLLNPPESHLDGAPEPP
ncbi:unnamed protein product [Prorocentrum cordatum]|uniref:Magnesium transporter MgtE intracellular domain-containing protein n=1 Tax=Prorocentrum cordatum TaxID=2364126 RepID=A0ABN9PJ04_9DINO|nr:unnamed protein product [Polarella glacialis]